MNYKRNISLGLLAVREQLPESTRKEKLVLFDNLQLIRCSI